MDESKVVYKWEGIIIINKEEQHCEKQMVKINSFRGDKKQISDVKVKATSEYLADGAHETEEFDPPAASIQKSDFRDIIPFSELDCMENEYDMTRAEYCYAKAMAKLTHGHMSASMSVKTEISISDMEEEMRIHHLDETLDNYLSAYCDYNESHFVL